MLKPTKYAFLKHDLYELPVSHLIGKAYPLEEIPEIKPRKTASKGARFVYCETDRKDAGMGWFADNGTGIFREGNCGFGKMSGGWAKEHLTQPVPIDGLEFRDRWDVHPEMVEHERE